MKRTATVRNIVEHVVETNSASNWSSNGVSVEWWCSLSLSIQHDTFPTIWMVRVGSQYKSSGSNNKVPLQRSIGRHAYWEAPLDCAIVFVCVYDFLREKQVVSTAELPVTHLLSFQVCSD